MSLKAVSCLVVVLFGAPALAELGATPRAPEASEPRSAAQAEAPAQGLAAEPASRGQMLYENHCTGCHESVVFVRERRTVDDLQQLRAMVRRWVREIEAPWGAEEIDDVVQHLNDSYYQFPS